MMLRHHWRTCLQVKRKEADLMAIPSSGDCLHAARSRQRAGRLRDFERWRVQRRRGVARPAGAVSHVHRREWDRWKMYQDYKTVQSKSLTPMRASGLLVFLSCRVLWLMRTNCVRNLFQFVDWRHERTACDLSWTVNCSWAIMDSVSCLVLCDQVIVLVIRQTYTCTCSKSVSSSSCG